MKLFPSSKIVFNLPDAEIEYYPDFFNTEESAEIFEKLMAETPWQQDTITVFGKKHLQPRLTALFGDESKPYSYSGITMKPHPWNSVLLRIKKRIETETGCVFTSALLNLYRNGKDSNGWHADNEKELGPNPVIASVSFGAKRKFQLKHMTRNDLKHTFFLENGSLLIMKGTTQHYWKHQIPKTQHEINARINLTFRIIL